MLLKHPTRYRAAPQQTIIWSKVPVVLGAGPCFTGSLDICGGAIPACPYTHFITFFFLQSCLRYFYMNLSLRMNFKVRFPSSMKTLSRAWLELHCFYTKWELVAKGLGCSVVNTVISSFISWVVERIASDPVWDQWFLWELPVPFLWPVIVTSYILLILANFLWILPSLSLVFKYTSIMSIVLSVYHIWG